VKKTPVEVMGMKTFRLRWVPHELTVAEKRQRVADSRRLLQALVLLVLSAFIPMEDIQRSRANSNA
jgi:hypothetical protein